MGFSGITLLHRTEGLEEVTLEGRKTVFYHKGSVIKKGHKFSSVHLE